MRKRIAIYGAGGFGRETRFLLKAMPEYEFAGFIDDAQIQIERAEAGTFKHVAIAIANGDVRRRIYQSATNKFDFPNLIHPGVDIDPSNSLGQGAILCAGVKLTVGIEFGDFVIVNLNATIGHDVKIGAYASIMPAVNISGAVRIGTNVFIGTGATVLQGLSIGDNTVIGAGAVVTKDVPPGVVAKGVPARFYKK